MGSFNFNFLGTDLGRPTASSLVQARGGHLVFLGPNWGLH